ncbi:MAG: heparinase II/III-family protein, partial [Natronospirillum sp.]
IRGLEWLMAMCHPDGKIAFFNDATFGIAPNFKELSHYAHSLGLPGPEREKPRMLTGTLFRESGYGVVEWPEDHRLLVDVAPVGPDYQPGHAHADTLSCELSLFGQRVLVNSGISQYGEGEERHRQRSTAAHNTVEVNGENSSEVWAGFRVARRATPFGVSLENREGHFILQAGHDGYKRLAGRPVHHRRWVAMNEGLTVEDELIGDFQRAVAYWHFHPEVRVEQEMETNRFKAYLPDNQVVVIEVSGGTPHLGASAWHPGFGVSNESQKLTVTFTSLKLTTRIFWSLD